MRRGAGLAIVGEWRQEVHGRPCERIEPVAVLRRAECWRDTAL